MKRIALGIIAALTICGCANPLNQVTYGRYTDEGNRAYAVHDFERAEAAFAKAAYNVDWGNLGEAAKAASLYNLGETKRIMRKYSEAESILMQALPFAERGWEKSPYKLQMLYTSIVLLYFDTHDASKGWPFLQKTFDIPNSHENGANVRWFEVYGQYETELVRLGMQSEARKVREEIEKRQRNVSNDEPAKNKPSIK